MVSIHFVMPEEQKIDLGHTFPEIFATLEAMGRERVCPVCGGALVYPLGLLALQDALPDKLMPIAFDCPGCGWWIAAMPEEPKPRRRAVRR